MAVAAAAAAAAGSSVLKFFRRCVPCVKEMTSDEEDGSYIATNANVTCNIVCCRADNRGPGDSDEYFKTVVARAEPSSSCKPICSAVEDVRARPLFDEVFANMEFRKKIEKEMLELETRVKKLERKTRCQADMETTFTKEMSVLREHVDRKVKQWAFVEEDIQDLEKKFEIFHSGMEILTSLVQRFEENASDIISSIVEEILSESELVPNGNDDDDDDDDDDDGGGKSDTEGDWDGCSSTNKTVTGVVQLVLPSEERVKKELERQKSVEKVDEPDMEWDGVDYPVSPSQADVCGETSIKNGDTVPVVQSSDAVMFTQVKRPVKSWKKLFKGKKEKDEAQ